MLPQYGTCSETKNRPQQGLPGQKTFRGCPSGCRSTGLLAIMWLGTLMASLERSGSQVPLSQSKLCRSLRRPEVPQPPKDVQPPLDRDHGVE